MRRKGGLLGRSNNENQHNYNIISLQDKKIDSNHNTYQCNMEVLFQQIILQAITDAFLLIDLMWFRVKYM